jgi:hypothetical protein
MRRILVTFLLLGLAAGSTVAQKTKPWNEWAEKEAAKILNDSPWGQTQTEGGEKAPTASDAVVQVSGASAMQRQISRDGESGESRPERLIKYRVRFLTAKPVRAAFARILMLRKSTTDEAFVNQLQGFVDRDFGDYLVIAFTAEASDAKLVAPMMEALANGSADVFKEKVYLERKDGKRLALADYRPPGPDGMGAKFVFMRTLEGQPFLTTESDNVRFVAAINDKVKLNMRYKVSEMIYDGKLEY